MSFSNKGARLGIALALLLAASDSGGQSLFSGAQGALGAQGARGAQDAQSAQVPGAQGARGAQGAQGALGALGALGARGAQGAQVLGAQGARVQGASNAIVRTRHAVIDMPLLASAGIEALTAAPSTSLVLNLFDDVVLVAVGERVETDAWGHRSWVGRVEGVPNSTVTLTWIDGTVVGTVHAGAAVYRIDAAGGVATISEIDPSSGGTETQPLQPPTGDMASAAAVPAPDLDDSSPSEDPQVAMRSEPTGADDIGVVDVFVYYTQAAEARQGGAAAIQALVAKGIADTNTAFVRSHVPGLVRLVGTSRATGYVEDPFNLETDLRNMTFAREATAARDAAGADIVVLVVAEPAGGACGIAWLGPSPAFAFSVSAAPCLADGQWTFTHEIAHNFGSHHNIENAGGGAFRAYSYGYVDAVSGFRTVMSYPGPCSGCPRILNYSNPASSFGGKPAGSTFANNARSLSEAFPVVASFRAGPTGVPGPPRDLRAAVSGLSSSISWAPPTSGGAATTYIGQAGSTPGASDLFNGPLGLVNSVSVATWPGIYYARVLARNDYGTSAPSNEVAVTVGISCDTPLAPVVTATVTGRTARVSWSAMPGVSTQGYTVLVGSSPGASDVYRIPTGLTTEIAGTLQPGTYHVRVAAHAGCGAASTSDEVVLRIPAS